MGEGRLAEVARFLCGVFDRAPFGLLVVEDTAECLAANATFASRSQQTLDSTRFEGARLDLQVTSIADALRGAWAGQATVVETDEPPLVGRGQGAWCVHCLPLEVAGQRGAVLVYQDLTEHRLTIDAFQASEQRFRQMVDCAGDGIVVYRSGVLLYVNPEAVRLLGHDSPDEIVGRPVLDLVAPSEHAGLSARLADAEAGGGSSVFEMTFLCRDGGGFPAECRLSRAPVDEAEVGYLYIRNISDRKRLQVRRENARRVDALARLASTVSEEWQSWIVRARRIAGRLREKGQDPSALAILLGEFGEVLDGAQARAASLSVCVTSESFDTETAELEAIVASAVGSLHHDADTLLNLAPTGRERSGSPGGLSIDLEPCNWPVRGPVRALGEAIAELARAVHRARRPDSTLRVGGRRGPDTRLRPPSYLLRIASELGSDSDVPRSHGPPVALPFASWEVGKDMLLLAAFSTLQTHGAWVDVHSGTQGGLWFEVELPLVKTEASGPESVGRHTSSPKEPVLVDDPDGGEEPAITRRSEAIAESTSLANATSRSVPRVLVCDDERRLVTLTAGLLTEYGYDVVSVPSGAEAVQQVASQPVDVVVLDVNLPGEDALNIIAQLNSQRPVPIILSSGYAEDDVDPRLLEAPSVKAFLSKPYGVDTLVAMIERVRAG